MPHVANIAAVAVAVAVLAATRAAATRNNNNATAPALGRRGLKEKHGSAKEKTLGPPSEVPPTVFILGAQKGGSSSLMWELITHPQLCDGERKETHYFLGFSYGNKVSDGMSFDEIKTDYLSIFRDKKCVGRPASAFIDGTPVLHHLEVAGNMHAFYDALGMKDDLKLLVMLREPVSRDYSWYQHKIRQFLTGHVTGQGFDEARKGAVADLQTFQETYSFHVDAVNKGELQRSEVPLELAGDYITQLLEFLKYFRRDQMLIFNSNLAFTRPAEAMEAIRQFLGVEHFTKWDTDPFPHDDHLGSTYHSGDPTCVLKHIPKMDCGFRDTLAGFYAQKNDELDQWMRRTKKKAPPSEPDWEPFGNTHVNISCVVDARAALDEVIAEEKKETC